jgi:hypothetical protein
MANSPKFKKGNVVIRTGNNCEYTVKDCGIVHGDYWYMLEDHEYAVIEDSLELKGSIKNRLYDVTYSRLLETGERKFYTNVRMLESDLKIMLLDTSRYQYIVVYATIVSLNMENK